MTTDHGQNGRAATSRIFWWYLVGVTLAELCTAVVEPRVGLVLHLMLLLGALTLAAVAPRPADRQLGLALTLAPLIRLLSLALPLQQLPQLAWYPAVAVPLLISTWLIARHTGLRWGDLGFGGGSPALNLSLMLSGIAFGVIEFAILSPRAPLVAPTPGLMVLAALTLTIFTGFSEELIFRGLLQTLGLRAMGAPALIYISLLFGVLHIGYLSLSDVVFVSAVGLVFALAVYRGASLLAASISHGITNLILLQVAPLSVSGHRPAWADTALIALLALGALGLCGLAALLPRARTHSSSSHLSRSEGPLRP